MLLTQPSEKLPSMFWVLPEQALSIQDGFCKNPVAVTSASLTRSSVLCWPQSSFPTGCLLTVLCVSTPLTRTSLVSSWLRALLTSCLPCLTPAVVPDPTGLAFLLLPSLAPTVLSLPDSYLCPTGQCHDRHYGDNLGSTPNLKRFGWNYSSLGVWGYTPQ